MHANIKKYYVYCFFYLFVLFEPILLVYFEQRLLLSITQIMIAMAVFVIVAALCEIPTGVLGDKIGYKNTLLVGSLTLLLASIGYALSQSFLHVLIAEVIWGLGFALISGTPDSFLYDTLKNLNKENEFQKINGRANAIFWVGLATSAVLGGLLAKIDLALPILLTPIAFLLQFFVILTFREPKRARSTQHPWAHTKEAFSHAFTTRKLRFLISYMVIISLVIASGYQFFQPHMLRLGLDIALFGVVFAVGYLASGFGALVARRIERLTKKRTLILLLFAALIGSIITGLISSLLAMIGILILIILDGMQGPILVDYINKRVKSHNRATINSIASLSGSVVLGALLPFYGMLADATATSSVFLVNAVIIILALVIMMPRQAQHSKTPTSQEALR